MSTDNKNYFPHLVWVRSFEASARHLSFTLAAREMGLTQAAVSKHVKYLELYLGAPLFERKTRTLALTDAGRAYLPKVQDGFERLTRGTQEVFGRDVRPVLTLRVISSFAVNWLVPRLRGFRDAHPDVELRILTSVWAETIAGNEIDLDIRYGTGNWKDLRADPLTQDRLYPLAAPRLAERLRSYEDLALYKLIHVIGYQEGWQDWLAAAMIANLDFESEQVDSSLVAYEMAREAMGVALGRESLARRELEKGGLVRPFELEIKANECFFLLSKLDEPRAEVQILRDWILSKANS